MIVSRAPLTLLLALAGCTIATPRPNLATPPSNKEALGLYARADGTLVHEISGAEFPSRIGDLTRGEPRLHDPGGSSISLQYQRQMPPLTISVYVYPRTSGEDEPSDEFQQSLESAVQIHSAEVQLAEPSSMGKAPRTLHGFLAGFTWVESARDFDSWLLLVPSPRWYYKVRTTCPTQSDEALDEAFLTGLALLQDVVLGPAR